MIKFIEFSLSFAIIILLVLLDYWERRLLQIFGNLVLSFAFNNPSSRIARGFSKGWF
jgi:hypothetical protein